MTLLDYVGERVNVKSEQSLTVTVYGEIQA